MQVIFCIRSICKTQRKNWGYIPIIKDPGNLKPNNQGKHAILNQQVELALLEAVCIHHFFQLWELLLFVDYLWFDVDGLLFVRKCCFEESVKGGKEGGPQQGLHERPGEVNKMVKQQRMKFCSSYFPSRCSALLFGCGNVHRKFLIFSFLHFFFYFLVFILSLKLGPPPFFFPLCIL